jgi:hypothetical protein
MKGLFESWSAVWSFAPMTGPVVAAGILGGIIIREVNLMRASPIAEESAASAIRRASVELSEVARFV